MSELFALALDTYGDLIPDETDAMLGLPFAGSTCRSDSYRPVRLGSCIWCNTDGMCELDELGGFLDGFLSGFTRDGVGCLVDCDIAGFDQLILQMAGNFIWDEPRCQILEPAERLVPIQLSH